jgi:chemotaxis protein MotB
MAATKNTPIIVRRVKKADHGGHHGGAWKVAYADFVTAMMAFFLLLWLINVTSPDQKRGIADYFAPSAASRADSSGAGGVLGGRALTSQGALSSGSTPSASSAAAPQANTLGKTAEQGTEGSAAGDRTGTRYDGEEGKTAAERERRQFRDVEAQLRQAIKAVPDMAELANQVIIDQTPEGLRIQLIDQQGRSMFPAGSVEMYPRTRKLLEIVGKVVERMPNRITITGHTDGSKFADPSGRTNWELSSERANASRRVLVAAGIGANRIYQVSGKADSEPLFPEDPMMPGNRRIAITLMREAPVVPPDLKP